MKTIGLIGGMSWESTVPYYRIINQMIRQQLGGFHSAKLLLYSVDFHDIEQLQARGDWEAAGLLLADAARRLHLAGADFLVLCTNTMHKVAAAITQATPLPLLHIADATAKELLHAGCLRIGLLGTRFTMEQEFYRDRLASHGIQVLVPAQHDRDLVHRVIYEELVQGQVLEPSRQAYRRIIADLVAAGAQAVVLGCTEIAMLVSAADAPVPVFDTVHCHAQAAANMAIQGF